MRLFPLRRSSPDVQAVQAEESGKVVMLQTRIRAADRIIRRYLAGQSLLEPSDRNDGLNDVLLEVMVELGLAPRAGQDTPSIPVIPGRSS